MWGMLKSCMERIFTGACGKNLHDALTEDGEQRFACPPALEATQCSFNGLRKRPD